MFFMSLDVFVFLKISSNYFVAVYLIEILFQKIKDIKTLLFADDQVTEVDSEHALQISVHKLETFAPRWGLKIPTRKTKTLVFKGSDSVRSKIAVNNNVIGSGKGDIDWVIWLRIGTGGGHL
jgi:hypothetical protein